MKPVRLEILIDDKTMQGLNSAKGNLSGMEQFYKQIIGRLKAELTELHQKMKSSMSEGINTDKQAAEIQALTGVVNQLTDELDKLTQAKKLNNSTPIVGNDPAPKLKNIQMSMAQIARELPSLSMGPQMFFLAISNNLPLLQDALISARNEFKLLQAKGEEAIPVWKQVGKAIVSPQAAIAVGITLLVMYGNQIVEWTKKIFSGTDAVISMKDAMENLNKEFDKVSNDLGKTVSSVKNLSESYRELGDDMNAKKEFITKNKDEFEKLGIAVNDVSEADNLLIDNTENYIKAMALRAEATALFNLQVKEQEKALKKQREASQRETNKPTIWDNYYANLASGAGSITGAIPITSNRPSADDYRKTAVNIINQEKEAAEDNAKAYGDMRKAKLEEAAALLKASGIREKTSTNNEEEKQKTDYAKELAEARVKAQQKLEHMLIETEQDGYKKRKALAQQRYNEEIYRISQDEKNQIETINKARKKGQQIDTNAENKVLENANKQRLAAKKIYIQSTDAIEKEWQEKSLQSWIAYYEKYGTYAQQRVAIIQKYALKINNTTDENEKALFTRQQEEALQELDEKFGKSTKQMTDLFEDASNKSVNAIQKIIDKYELLIRYFSEPESGITKEDLLAVGFTEKELRDLENGTIKINDVTKAVKDLKGELKGKSPFKSFTSDLKSAFDKIKKADGDTTKIGEGISRIGKSVTSFSPALKEFGESISTIFGIKDEKIQAAIGAVDGLGQTAEGVGKAMSGDIVGGIMSAVNGIADVITNLDTLFGADDTGYEEMKNQYEIINEIWDSLIEKKKEYIDISYGKEAVKAGKEALDLINKSIKSYRILGKERLASGSGWFSHSVGVNQNDVMGRQEWDEVKKALGYEGLNLIKYNPKSGLFDLSLEQLEKLKYEAPTFWAKLDGEVRDYLENIIEGSERLQDIQDQIKEQLTQTTFENVQDSFWNTLLDMKSDASDFSDDFSMMLQKSILKAHLGDLMQKDLKNWYDKFAQSNEDGNIDMQEYEYLQNEYNTIVKKGLEERNKLMELFGWKVGEYDTAQSGRSVTAPSITEETAGKLEGIGNAQLDHVISIDNRMEDMSDNLSSMASSMATVAENSEYLKKLEDISDNIQNMNNTGVKIKN